MTAAGSAHPALIWHKDDDPHWDADRERVFGSVPAGVFRPEVHVSGEPLPSDWWRVEFGGQVVGYGWLDDVWGDAEVLLAVDAPARGTGAGSFALARLEEEAQARGLNYVLNVVRDTHPDRQRTTAWFLAHGFTASQDGRLRKRVARGATDSGHAASGQVDGRQARYEAERDRVAGHTHPEQPLVSSDRAEGAEEAGGYEKDPPAPHRSQAHGGPLQEGRQGHPL